MVNLFFRFIVQCGNADIMQPGLLSLQPSLEEIMSNGFFNIKLFFFV